VSPGKRRVHESLICWRILIVYTPGWVVVGRLQEDLIHPRTAPKFFFGVNIYFFFCSSDRDFYSGGDGVSQVYTYIPKIQKKKLYKTLLSSILHFALNIGRISAQPHMLLFVICFSGQGRIAAMVNF
jgi:hypothetical protein